MALKGRRGANTAKEEKAATTWTANECRLYKSDNGNWLVIVRSDDHDNVKGYLNYSEVEKKAQELASSPSEKDAFGKRLFRADTFSMTFSEEPEVEDYQGKDFFDLEEVEVVGFEI
jgi:hypothetical protein